MGPGLAQDRASSLTPASSGLVTGRGGLGPGLVERAGDVGIRQAIDENRIIEHGVGLALAQIEREPGEAVLLEPVEQGNQGVDIVMLECLRARAGIGGEQRLDIPSECLIKLSS